MDMNVYALERHVEMKLREARAASAKAALISELRADRRQVSVLAGAGRWLLHRTTRWRDATLPTPTAP